MPPARAHLHGRVRAAQLQQLQLSQLHALLELLDALDVVLVVHGDALLHQAAPPPLPQRLPSRETAAARAAPRRADATPALEL